LRAPAITLEDFKDEGIVLALHRPVSNFEYVKQLGHALDEIAGARKIGEFVEKMVEDKEEARLTQIAHEFLAVRAQRLDFTVLGFAQPVDSNMNLVPKFRKEGGDFFSHNEIGEVAEAMEHFQAPVDRIVIGDRHQIHTPLFRLAVNVQRSGVTVARAQKPQMLYRTRVTGVAVQVGLIELGG